MADTMAALQALVASMDAKDRARFVAALTGDTKGGPVAETAEPKGDDRYAPVGDGEIVGTPAERKSGRVHPFVVVADGDDDGGTDAWSIAGSYAHVTGEADAKSRTATITLKGDAHVLGDDGEPTGDTVTFARDTLRGTLWAALGDAFPMREHVTVTIATHGRPVRIARES